MCVHTWASMSFRGSERLESRELFLKMRKLNLKWTVDGWTYPGSHRVDSRWTCRGFHRVDLPTVPWRKFRSRAGTGTQGPWIVFTSPPSERY